MPRETAYDVPPPSYSFSFEGHGVKLQRLTVPTFGTTLKEALDKAKSLPEVDDWVVRGIHEVHDA